MLPIQEVVPPLDLNRYNNEHPHRENDQLWTIDSDQQCSEEDEGAETLGKQKTGDTFRTVEDVVVNHDVVVVSADVVVVDVDVVVVDVDVVVVDVDVVVVDVDDVVTSDGAISASLRSTLLPTDRDLTLPRGNTSSCAAFRGDLGIPRGIVVAVDGCTTDAIDGTLI
ncbi:unnamed protein product [Angiostrongylus costaricensis]|uniref:Uncharacterized protein n=1 Tax=Angiostrongylus costaricensis TaxID=334426 RepID=A0A0R3PL12_ANGCS|nr:unnamed protein product [Angiostrongylus costaricensis]